MLITDLIAMCLRNLLRRKVRTILTVLGVVIGTSSVVVMISLGVGLRQNFEAEMASYMDLTAISVMPADESGGNKVKLDDKMVEKIARLDHVEVVSPILYLSGVAEIVSGRYTYGSEIIALDFATMAAFGYQTVEGKLTSGGAQVAGAYYSYGAPWSFIDMNATQQPNYEMDDDFHYVDPPPVDVMTAQFSINSVDNQIGSNAVADSLPQSEQSAFQGYSADTKTQSPLADLQTSGQSHTLLTLGTLEENYSLEGAYFGVVISLPLGKELIRQYQAINGIQENIDLYQTIKVKVDNMENVPAVAAEINALGLPTQSAEQFRESMTTQASLIQVILGGLGAISLFVAALGITNTMIMSIYERTREIGVMKVLGCRLQDIRLMFLVEAGAIGFFGGGLGIICSYLLSFLINFLVGIMNEVELSMGISIIPFWLVLLGMGVAVGVGLIAGFSPANRAVKISALTAIRQD